MGESNERQLSDKAILETLREAAAAHTELLNRFVETHETLLLMSERLDLLQQKISDLEQRLDRAQL